MNARPNGYPGFRPITVSRAAGILFSKTKFQPPDWYDPFMPHPTLPARMSREIDFSPVRHPFRSMYFLFRIVEWQ